jgi:hypothetical protein
MMVLPGFCEYEECATIRKIIGNSFFIFFLIPER